MTEFEDFILKLTPTSPEGFAEMPFNSFSRQDAMSGVWYRHYGLEIFKKTVRYFFDF
jgi:hypothetical protein